MYNALNKKMDCEKFTFNNNSSYLNNGSSYSNSNRYQIKYEISRYTEY